MKMTLPKKTLAAGAVSMLSFAAHAQSSVTLYGIVDTSIAYFNHTADTNGKDHASTFQTLDGSLGGPRWGLKGREDLGAGLSAIFQIENGFSLSTGKLGQGSREFGRQAFVGLADENLGKVTLGRQYDPLVDLLQPLTEDDTFGSAFATPGDVDNYDNSVRINNTIKYSSPNYRGLQAVVLYGFGGVAGSTGTGQTWSGAVAYNSGPVGLGVGYYHSNAGSTVTAGTATRTFTSSSDDPYFSSVNDGYASARSIQIIRAAGDYKIGQFTFGAAFSNVDYARDNLSVFVKDTQFNSSSAFVNYQATPNIIVGAGYSYTLSSGSSSAKYNQFSLGGQLSLSKRTSLYALAAYQKASGTTLSSTGVTEQATASIGSYGTDSGVSKQALVLVGIHHSF